MGYVLGIDLGTTYSAAAVAEGDRVDIVQLGSRAATIPSIVVLRDDGEILVGDAAERRAGSEPARAAREFKRRLGDPTPMIVGGSPFGAEALMAQVLRAIVKQVSDERGEPPSLIAVTHPASYGDYKLDLLRQMVRQAEAGEAVFIPEPVAAAVHYASQERIEPGSTVAVYDFGGGTFDAAVLRKTDSGSFEILGRPEGLERLGGIDFDEAVFSHVAETLGRAALEGDGGATARAAIGRLREECRDAKESLSADTEATIPVLLPAIQTEVRLTRAELEDIVRPRVRETAAALERSVRSAGLGIEDIDRILLVGGSSRIPLVGQVLREMTGRPISRDAHPKHAIALGAARFALDHGVPVAVPSPTSAKAEPGPVIAPDSPAAPPAIPPEPVPPAVAAASIDGPSTASPAVAPDVQKAPATAAPARASSGAEAGASPASGGRRRWLLAGGGVLVVVVAAAVAAVFALGGGGSASAAAKITNVQVSGDAYQVWFETSGFAPSQAGDRVRFYWNTQSPSDQSAPGDYWGASPVVVAATSDRPANATQLCAVVADANSTAKSGTGNCWNLPG